MRRAVRSAIAERWNKKPICHVHVLSRVGFAGFAGTLSGGKLFIFIAKSRIGPTDAQMVCTACCCLPPSRRFWSASLVAALAGAVLFFGVWLISNIAVTFDTLKNPTIAAASTARCC